jgi:hypothetical protein
MPVGFPMPVGPAGLHPKLAAVPAVVAVPADLRPKTAGKLAGLAAPTRQTGLQLMLELGYYHYRLTQ